MKRGISILRRGENKMMRLARREMKEDRISFHFEWKMGLLVVLPLDRARISISSENPASLPPDGPLIVYFEIFLFLN
jgi:hypothetical protein